MRRPKHVSYEPRYGNPWGYPLSCYPPRQLPPIRNQASVRGMRPTNRKTTDHHPIAPVHPFPPDPYIGQFRLSEALQTGTLFQWLHTPDEDEPKWVRAAEQDTNTAESGQTEKPKPGSQGAHG